jgi:hypothetical protein
VSLEEDLKLQTQLSYMDTNNLENNLEQDGQCRYKGNIEALLGNHCCRGKAISVAFSECVPVVLVIQHAKRMRRIMLPSVASLVLPHFPKLSHKWHDFGKQIFGHKICFDLEYYLLGISRRLN